MTDRKACLSNRIIMLFFLTNIHFWKEIKMQNFLNKYNAVKLENTQDEGKLTLDSSKKRILKMLDENMKHIKNNSWNIKNRMNKLIVDTETNSIFTLRLGGKKIIKYSLYLLNDREKLNFLSDFYDSIVNNEFDTEILNFISQELENSQKRRKASLERRKLKKQQEKEEATKRTIAAASSLIEETMSQSLPRYAQL